MDAAKTDKWKKAPIIQVEGKKVTQIDSHVNVKDTEDLFSDRETYVLVLTALRITAYLDDLDAGRAPLESAQRAPAARPPAPAPA
jgi:hypothetical protein